MTSSRIATAVALPTQVPLLSKEQLAHFKREGYLVLPAALDPALCARARDHMWSVIGEEVPRMRRHDPGTWTPFDQDAEPTGATRAEGADHPYFSCGGHRFYLKCGVERLFLDLFPRALWAVAEQLLGEGEVFMPTEPAADGLCRGPVFISMDGADHKMLAGVRSHAHLVADPSLPPSMVTEELAVPPHNPAVGIFAGTRGIYCTLPGSEASPSNTGVPGDALGYRGAHSDITAITTRPNVHPWGSKPLIQG